MKIRSLFMLSLVFPLLASCAGDIFRNNWEWIFIIKGVFYAKIN